MVITLIGLRLCMCLCGRIICAGMQARVLMQNAAVMSQLQMKVTVLELDTRCYKKTHTVSLFVGLNPFRDDRAC
jgi:hypothetical protein